MKILALPTYCLCDTGQVNFSECFFCMCKREGKRERIAFSHGCCRDQRSHYLWNHFSWLLPSHWLSSPCLSSLLPLLLCLLLWRCVLLSALCQSIQPTLIIVTVSQTLSRPWGRRHCPGPHGAWGTETCPWRWWGGWLVRVTRRHRWPEKECHARFGTIKTSWRRYGEKGTFLQCWWKCKLVQPLRRTVWRFLRKLKTELPYDPAIPLLGIYPEKMKTLIRKRYMHPNVHSSTIYNSQDMEATSVTIDRRMDKEDVAHIYIYIYIYIYIHTHTHTHTHTHNGILFSHKKEWNTAICNNMDRPRDDHTKWSKSDRERQILYDNTYMWDPKKNTNKLIYKIETDSQT